MGFATDQDQKDNERSKADTDMNLRRLARQHKNGDLSDDDYYDAAKEAMLL